MRIGLFGGMANNMYIFARALSRAGAEVCFVRDREDSYPMSQPAWEDVSTTMSFTELEVARHWSPAQWTAWEAEKGWQPPDWLVDPLAASDEITVEVPTGLSWADASIATRYVRLSPVRRASLAALSKCDALLLTTVVGALYGFLSGRPYVIVPHGGDIMLAADILPRIGWPLRDRFYDRFWRRVLPPIYRQALSIGMHDRTGQGGHLGDTRALLDTCVNDEILVATGTADRLGPDERRRQREPLLAELGVTLPTDGLFAFVPSRADFRWKGHDMLLKALAQLPGGRISILFAGWGADYQLARDMARQLGVADRVAFLGAVLSKPLLYRMFGIADLVIDQFHFGTYGTASLEAMGRGTPVMVAIDEAPYRDDPDNLPPVLNAWSVEDIARQLGAVLDGGIDLEMRSRAAQDWVARTHGEPAAARRFLNILERRLGAAPLAA